MEIIVIYIEKYFFVEFNMDVEMKEMKKMGNHFRRGEGPDAPVSDLTIYTNIIPVSHEHSERTPKRVCGVVIGR